MIPGAGQSLQSAAILNANKMLAEAGTRAANTPAYRTVPPGAAFTWLAWLGIGAAFLLLLGFLWDLFF